MNFRDLVKQKCRWLGEDEERGGIPLCSRVRIARNLEGTPFPNRASRAQLEAVSERVLSAAGRCSVLEDALIKRIDELSELDVRFLAERHLISREFTKRPPGSVVIIGSEGAANIMVNEEDHLRIQVMRPGIDAAGAWALADRLESEIAGELEFSFSAEWGYLTACPTNLGTGMRASVMLHLPMLVISRRIVRVLTGISKAGIAPRGAYGEGSEPSGNLFQLSNQITLGKTEESIAGEIERAALGVIEEEEYSRESVLGSDRRSLEDRVFRAYGLLKNARMISSVEALELLSHLRLGVSLGIAEADAGIINSLIFDVRPAHLQKLLGSEMDRPERDARRADYIRKKLRNPEAKQTDEY